jgi:NADH dehydrogenase
MSERTVPQVVVVGCGFAGLWAVRALARRPVQVKVLDQNNHHTFIPLLYQVAAGELEPEEIGYPVRGIFRGRRNVQFFMARVSQVDLDARLVMAPEVTLRYDYLIIAAGSVSDFYGLPGAAEHSLPLRTLDQGVVLRNEILVAFEKAVDETDPERRHRLLTFAIVGGGPTGVEFAGALSELLHGPLRRDFWSLDFSEVRVLLFQRDPRLLWEMAPPAGDYAAARLRKMGVEVFLEAPVSRITPTAVHLQDGRVFPAGTVVWTAGVRADPLPATWGLRADRWGRIPVLPTLQVPGRPEVYVIGDLASCEVGKELPQLASVAIQEGDAAARNIARQVAGKEPEPFRYRDRGTLATIGRSAAVAQFPRLLVRGFPAWVLWLTVHIFYLIGFRRRLSVLFSWGLDYFFQERSVRLILPSRAPTSEPPPPPAKGE